MKRGVLFTLFLFSSLVLLTSFSINSTMAIEIPEGKCVGGPGPEGQFLTREEGGCCLNDECCNYPATLAWCNQAKKDLVPFKEIENTVEEEVISENGNYEKGGTLKEWKERLQSETGPDSEPSKTAAECDELMKQKTAECSKHGGWRTDYMVEITDFRTDEHYELQDIRDSGCPATSPTGEEYSYAKTRDIDTSNLDSQAEGGESSYQVVCSVLCSSWSCGAPIGTEVGKIESLKGKVEVAQEDETWKQLELGDKVKFLDHIKVGKDSEVTIKFIDDTSLTQLENSYLVIDEFYYDPNQSSLERIFNKYIDAFSRWVTGILEKINQDPEEKQSAVVAVRG
ncbi:MAG: hypothetical protein Q8R47_04880 [Nanoarchaeota archaeon]|nr:hypothetical protein [Nanoarchaeota archaeon]